jgi:hypothetical protein
MVPVELLELELQRNENLKAVVIDYDETTRIFGTIYPHREKPKSPELASSEPENAPEEEPDPDNDDDDPETGKKRRKTK